MLIRIAIVSDRETAEDERTFDLGKLESVEFLDGSVTATVQLTSGDFFAVAYGDGRRLEDVWRHETGGLRIAIGLEEEEEEEEEAEPCAKSAPANGGEVPSDIGQAMGALSAEGLEGVISLARQMMRFHKG